MIKYSVEIQGLLQDIEVSNSDYEKAVARYESVAYYISEKLDNYSPDVFLQGSFKLGTAVRPLTEDGAYDIDIVCCLTSLNKQELSQYRLKEYIGEAVIGYTNAKKMIEKPHDGKRCWTIHYVDEHNFHLDILPAIPNSNSNNVLAFTDKKNPHYYRISNDWEISNPKDYYEWFLEISKHSVYKRAYAARLMQSVENVPDYIIRTPLQRAIQLFKRHAEVMFEDNAEYKPSSIIITTLTAKAFEVFGDQTDDFETMLGVLSQNLLQFLDEREGKKCLLNPVNLEENLSEKWMRDENYLSCFLKWQRQLELDFYLGSTETRIYALEQLKKKLHAVHPSHIKNADISILPYHKKPKWAMQIEKKVDIEAMYYKDGWRPIKLVSGEEIRKGMKLQFRVKADHLRNYDIYWQVTNTGFEAEKSCQLRGDFYDSQIIEGKKVRKESTAYTGEHFVEAYIVKNGICYGKSEPFCVNIR